MNLKLTKNLSRAKRAEKPTKIGLSSSNPIMPGFLTGGIL